MPVLTSAADWTGSFNGLTFGAGTALGLVAVGGWLDLQGVRTMDTPKAYGNGEWSGPDFLGGQLIDVQLDVGSDSVSSFADNVAALEAATQASNNGGLLPLSITLPGKPTQTRYAKVRRRVIPTDQEYEFGLTHASVQFYAPDPRRLGSVLTGSTSLPSTSGGLSVPFTVPFTIASTVVSGNVTLTNPGNATGPVTLRISGPGSGPVITHVSSGAQLVFSSSLTLAAGEWIDVDMEARTVLANGQSSRAQFVTSRGWSGFDPGDNTWAFSAQNYSAMTVSVTATPAWL